MKKIISDKDVVVYHGDSKNLVLPENFVDSIVCDPPAGIGFMGKAWDGDKGGRKQWIAWLAETLAASYKALKPGGHALVWAIPRTSHWTMTALEEMGFEIRDVVTHLFGTGFPKSANVGKMIDKTLGATREVVGGNPNHRPVSGTVYEGTYSGANTGAATVTAPGSPEAAKYEGFGTALKPAAEFWILCRKPLSEPTIAKNVLKWGTGALNIDACRIGESPGYSYNADKNGSTFHGDPCRRYDYSAEKAGKDRIESTKGRWPANVVHDGQLPDIPAQFFYVAKPNKKEKNAGLDHLESLTGGEATGRAEGSKGLDNPRAGAGRTGGSKNSHPTVKSTALMTWLIKMVTPPGGCVLDPFTGSGTTAVAALENGFRFIGCEFTEEYLPIIEGRIRHALSTRSKL